MRFFGCWRLFETMRLLKGRHLHFQIDVRYLNSVKYNTSKTTLSDLCLHVENVKRRDKSELFPEYNCLILSPANFWQQSVHNFNQDNNLLNTIFHNHVRILYNLNTNKFIKYIFFRI